MEVSNRLKELATARLETQGPGTSRIEKAPQSTLGVMAQDVVNYKESAPDRARSMTDLLHMSTAGLLEMAFGKAPEGLAKAGSGFTPSKSEQVDIVGSLPVAKAASLGKGLAGVLGLVKGQAISRGTSVPRELFNSETLSRRLTDPGIEGGMHVTVAPETSAGHFAYNWYTGEPGTHIRMKSNVSNPYWTEDTGSVWTPEKMADAILNRTGEHLDKMDMKAKGILPLEARKKVRALADEWLQDIGYDPRTGQHQVSVETRDRLAGKYNKKIQKVLRENGFDHISYINTAEGAPVESAIIFDRSDVEFLETEHPAAVQVPTKEIKAPEYTPEPDAFEQESVPLFDESRIKYLEDTIQKLSSTIDRLHSKHSKKEWSVVRDPETGKIIKFV